MAALSCCGGRRGCKCAGGGRDKREKEKKGKVRKIEVKSLALTNAQPLHHQGHSVNIYFIYPFKAGTR